jgi:hypothetical protein
MPMDAGARNPVDAVADRLEDLIPPAQEAGNEVLVTQARSVRLAGPLFLLLSVLLMPWTVVLAMTLPARQLSGHYDIAWSGFDVFLLTALAATGVAALRRSRYLATAATAAGTLLVVDAWFDVTTSLGATEQTAAIVLALAVELPLAGLCWWLARHSNELADRRITLLLRSGRHGDRRNRAAHRGAAPGPQPVCDTQEACSRA